MTDANVNNIAKQLSDTLVENSITSKLENIVNLIDTAASKTIDLVENGLPLTEFLIKECTSFSVQISKYKNKVLEENVNNFISSVVNSLNIINNNLEDILLSQKNHYGVAMVINKFIDDLNGLDLKLGDLLKNNCSEQNECVINTN